MDARHSSGTRAGGPQIEVVSWDDLAHLPDVLDELTRQVGDIVGHAERWVCSTEGFEPSPVCVLRGLVPVMDYLAEAFGAVAVALSRELAEVVAGLQASHAELLAAEATSQVACQVARRAVSHAVRDTVA